MGGNASWSIWPFSTDVRIGDNVVAGKNTGSPPIVAKLTASQVSNDDIDDGTAKGRAQADRYVKEQIKKGEFSAAAIKIGNESKATVIDTKPAPIGVHVNVNCAAIHVGFDLTTKITPNTTLGQFIYDLPQIQKFKFKVVTAQMGLTPADIVCNLANLCENVWEPIKRKYPNASMTNSLRKYPDIGAGPHGTGQGMDIQFITPAGASIPTRDYYAIATWVKDNIKFDQLILEYSTERGFLTSWLHIGIFAGDPRTMPGVVQHPYGKKVLEVNRVFTMMNHQIKAGGLANYGK